MDSLGKVNFLEVNPLAGLNPVDSDLPILCYKKGLTYQDLITGILHSAISRLSIKKLECVS
jgi:D-alanine-D-alanine ligase